MKVTLIYDFTVEEIEDFSKDRAIIEMTYGEYKQLRELLDEVWVKELGTPLGRKAKKFETKLRNYKTKSNL